MLDNRKCRRYFNKTSGVEHQRNSNWCVNHAVSSLLEAHFYRKYGTIEPLSNSWLMMLCKRNNADRYPGQTGTKEDIALDMACKYGCATEKDYPTWEDDDVDDNKFITPTKSTWDNALKYKPNKKIKLDKLEDILDAIDNNGGVVFKVKLYSEHINVGSNGFMMQPKKGSQPNGSHEIYCGAYDLDLEKFMNGRMEKGFLYLYESYGETRGFKGYVLVPIRYYTENVTGLYSNDKYFQTCYTVESKDSFKYQRICDKLVPPIPKNEIVMTVGSNKATHNGIVKTITPPQVYNSRTYLGVRSVGELLDCAVRWYPDTKKVTIYSKALQMNIEMNIGSKKCIITDTINGTREIELLSEPICPNGSTLLPVRDIGTLFRMNTNYDSKTKQVKLEGIL